MYAELKARFALWRTYRTTVRKLSDLDAAILRDIGFEHTGRGDIKACARQSAEAGPCT